MKTTLHPLLPALAALLLPCPSFAEMQRIGNYMWFYSLSDDSAIVTGVTPESGILAIPNSLGGKAVTSIGNRAFYDCSRLTSVTIPDSVTSIGSSAFRGCSGLTSITIPDGVTSIGYDAFYNCSGLTSITISDGVTSIGYDAFRGCSALTETRINITDNAKWAENSINSKLMGERRLFVNGEEVANFVIPDGVTSIAANAFSGCSGLTSITVPDGVTNIENSAFFGCSGLTSVTIPDSVTRIGNLAFSGCSDLLFDTNTISNVKLVGEWVIGCSELLSGELNLTGIRGIAGGAFSGCSGLTSILIPDGMTSIGDSAFEGCSGLMSITIPDSVTRIGNSAFSECSGLMSVTIGAGRTSLEGVPTSVYEFHIDGDSEFLTEIGGVLFSNDERNLIRFPEKQTGEYSIPDSVTNIEKSAFSGCSGLTSISIPDCVTSIGDGAFQSCSGLTSISIPDGVMSIGGDAFSDCSGLTSITIPDSVTSIGSGAFEGCSGLTSITIPDSVTSIGSGAFEGCSGLTSITIPDSVTSIGGGAFQSCSGLTSISIPDSVTSIGDSTFSRCSGLTSITIPDSVTSIGYYAFYNCSGLTSITIPDSVTSIGDGAFEGCSGLSSLVIGKGVTNIRTYAFRGCSGLVSVAIPRSVTSIGQGAFYGCSSLGKILLPSSFDLGSDNWRLAGSQITRYQIAVDFSANSGTLAGQKTWLPVEVLSEYGKFGSFPSPSRLGYLFSGWELHGAIIQTNNIVNETTNHVVIARWAPIEYRVTFDANGGMLGEGEESKVVAFGAAYGVLPTPTFESHSLKCWSLDGSAVTGQTIVATPFNHVLVAEWNIGIGDGVWEFPEGDGPIALGEPLVAPSGEIVIPDKIDGRPVVEIGADAFAGNASITSITIPSSVTNIADGAFAGCTGLKTVAVDSLRGNRFAAFLPDLAETVERVVFRDGVTAIPDNFFKGCTALRTMDLAESVVDIGTNVFEACSALETVVSNGLEICDGWVLGMANGASAPADLVIPEGVRGIAAGAFEGEWGIGTMSLPESLRFVGARAFKDCTSLESISVPEGVAKIDREAFRNCTYAQGLALPGTLREIGDGAFANASMLMGATIPDGVVSVGECAFSNCWRMLSVAIPQSVERVGDGAFADCRRVAGVTVPLHVRPMSELFPAAYASLETISISRLDLEALEHLEGLESENAIQAYIASRQMVPDVFKGCAALEGIELPAWVRNVSDGALEGCSAIASLELPDAVTNVGARACAGMAALESVALPASLVSIGDEAFDGDAGLAALNLPEGLRTIGERAFRGLVPLARAEIPGSVRAIGDGAFAGCASIRAVSIPGDAGTVAAAFPDCYADIVSATVVAEDGSPGELAPPKLTAGLFEGCAALTSVELPAELAEIGAEAFADCTSLAEIGLPAAVTNLGERAFAGCGTLSSIALPKSLEELRDGTFAGCAAMAEIVVPESVRRFGNGIFSGCTLLRSVRFVGNAPDYGTADGGPYAGVPAGAKSYVANGSKGWDGIATSMALPEYWPADTTYEIAFWTPNRCAVSFDANYEGAGEPAEVEQVTGTSYVLPPNPVRLGARFDGWWTAPENGARITASTQVTATRPHTFYAHWTMNRYYVHFDANGGSGTAEPVEMTVGTPAPLPPCPFAKVAHDFAGWATEPGGEVVYADGAQVADLAYTQNAAVTLYAVWQARDWTLADYLDAPGLAFETAGGGAWGPDWNDAKAGGVSLRCDGLPPSAAGGTVEATLRSTVVGAGTLSFWWKASCEEMDDEYGDWFDYAAFSVDGVETAKIAGESGWRKVECAVEGAGEHGLVWAFVRDDYDEDGADWENALWVDGVEWTPAPVTLSFDAGGATEGAPPAAVVKYEGYALALPGPGTLADPPRVFAGWSDGESVYAAGATYVFGSADAVLTAVWTLQTWTLAEAVDAPALVFATGGDADWAVDATAGWTNGVSAKSGSVTNSQASWIETTVSGAGTLSFRWKVLGGIYRNTPFAYAKAEVDGTPASSTHLTDGWEAQALDIVGAGPHTIRWTYLRTSARDCDGDCAWLDGVEWTPTDATTIVVEGVSIPISWLDEAAATFVAANGGDYAAAARATAANGRNKVWECYVAGLDPTNAASRFLATIAFDENGVPDIGWTPDLGGARDYAVDGKLSLTNDWSIPDADSRFFRVRIAMPGGFGFYTISFDTDGGSTLAAITAAYGSPVTAPEPPTKDGYDFAGWSPPLPATMPARNLTAVAQWTPIGLFVDAESGDDANDGRQRATAKKTIQAAIDAAPDGGTIRVAPGVYGTIVNSGSKALRIESEAGPERTVIDGQGRRRCAKLSNQEAARDPCATLVGFTLRNGCRNDAGVGGAYLGRLESCVVSNCVAANEAAAAANCELLNCLVVGNVASNLNATTRGYICNNAVLRNCTVVGNRTVEGNGAPLFRGGVLRNCIVWDNDRFGTAAFSSDTTVDHVATDAAGEGDIPLSSSPFSDAANGDYRLAAGSPCIDAGAGTFEPDATDLAGNPRVSGAAVDAGCYEWQPVSPDSTGLSIRDSDIGE